MSLTKKGYDVTGVTRNSVPLEDMAAVQALLNKCAPDEIYYLAAYHHSSEDKYPGDLELFRRSYEVNAFYPLHFLEAIRALQIKSRFFYASSSLIFGDSPVEEQHETSVYYPHSAYGITKLDGLMTCRYYRENHGLFASTGILFNHESQYRQAGFLSKKITTAVWNSLEGSSDKLVIGNSAAEVDWGYAPDYVEAMHQVLLADQPGEFIIASGRKQSVRDFLEIAFGVVGLNWQDHVIENQTQLQRNRRTIVGSPARLKKATGWEPKTDFAQMIKLLVDAEGVRRKTCGIS